MDKKIERLCAFLDSAHSVFHAVAALSRELENAGYTCLRESERWTLKPGGKYYMTRSGSAIMAFRIPAGKPSGFVMSASHSDRPTFKIKENPVLAGKYTRIATEKYGGMLIAPWLDRPLSVAGRAVVETPHGIRCTLVDVDRDLLLIPNVAIHMNRKANDGYAFNPAVDTLPLAGAAESKDKWDSLLQEAAGGKILGHDLYLYVRQKASVWGLEEEYLSAPAIDDLECAWCCTQGFLAADPAQSVPVLCVFDSEEVGSSSLQGAGSDLLQSLLTRICDAMDWDLPTMLASSFMVSADNAHAIHPNHPEYADGNNAPVVNGGVVLKFNANQRYTTDGVSAALFRKVCAKAGVPVQTYCNRADMPGGSTLGNISLCHVSVPTVDIGLPQLAMHSCYETAGVKDALYLMDAMKVCYERTIRRQGDETFIIM